MRVRTGMAAFLGMGHQALNMSDSFASGQVGSILLFATNRKSRLS
jgi:hypothetical protein